MDATDERVAIVTGASKGLGAAITRRFAAGGIRVVACARSEDKLKEVAKADPDRIFPIPCDVTQSRQVKHLIDKTLRRFGRIDKIGRASCRERVQISVGAGAVRKQSDEEVDGDGD